MQSRPIFQLIIDCVGIPIVPRRAIGTEIFPPGKTRIIFCNHTRTPQVRTHTTEMTPGVCKLVIVFLLVTVCCFTGRVASDFSAVAPNIVVQDFQLQGNGSLATTSMVITLGAPTTASVLYHGTAQNVLDGFTTTMVMSITECDEIVWGRGADG